MSQLVTMNQTITLKEITDLLEVQHSNAMMIVKKMSTNSEFGLVTKISYQYQKSNGTMAEVETYLLNKRQSIAAASRLNPTLVLRIIDHWEELENDSTEPLADYNTKLKFELRF